MILKDNGNIKDRGNSKWTSLMLVEHKRKLRELKEQEQYQEKPELDSQQLEHMNYLLQKAFSENKSVKIEYYHKGKMCQLSGKVTKVIKEERKLIVEGKEGKKNLQPDQILNIIMMD